jgi:hypothetical protein
MLFNLDGVSWIRAAAAQGQQVEHSFDIGRIRFKIAGCLVPPESAATVPDGDNQCSVQSSSASLIGVRGDAGRFDKTVKGFVVRPKAFVV